MDDKRQPWEQLPGENSLWYGRFKAWLHQKKPRSMLALWKAEKAEKGGKPAIKLPHAWDIVINKFHWYDRAAAWDKAEQERLDRELFEKRERQRERELRAADRLYGKAEDLMDLPHERIVEEEEFTVHYPDHKAFKTAADLYAEARTNARAALEMPIVNRYEHTGANNGPLSVNVTGLSETDRLARILEILGAAAEGSAGEAPPESGDS